MDQDLYGGFIGAGDRKILNQLRELDGYEIANRSVHFQDHRLNELLFRYRARNFPESLNEEEQEQWQQHCTDRLHDGAGGALTAEAFFDRIDQLSEEADERAEEILGALYDYAEQIIPMR